MRLGAKFGLDQINDILGEVLDCPRHRAIGRRLTNPTAIERGVTKLRFEEGHLVRIPRADRSTCTRHPDDVRSLTHLLVVNPCVLTVDETPHRLLAVRARRPPISAHENDDEYQDDDDGEEQSDDDSGANSA